MSKPGEPIVLPSVEPPVRVEGRWARHRPAHDAFTWLQLGWRDFLVDPGASIAYGMLVFAASFIVVGALFMFGADYILFPALAGFMVVGPILAVGLYEKSRRIDAGEPVSLARMIFVHPRSQRQILFSGVLLCVLMLLWMRAAVLIYALFFGFRPFPGLGNLVPMLFGTPVGWAMLLVGSCVGALFAAFSFAISALSIPMLMERKLDALTAMGTSTAVVGKNLPVMLTWGAIVLGLFLFSVATGLLGLIFVFPLLGHGTWHAYRAMAPHPEPEADAPIESDTDSEIQSRELGGAI